MIAAVWRQREAELRSCNAFEFDDLLAGADGNVYVCGDDDQPIHGWRHADPRHILGFAERHPGHIRIVLG